MSKKAAPAVCQGMLRMDEGDSGSRALASLLLAALEQAPQAVFLLHPDGRVRYANAAARRQFTSPAQDGALPAALVEAGLEARLCECTEDFESRMELSLGGQRRHCCVCFQRLQRVADACWMLQVRDDEERSRVEDHLQRRIAFEQLIGRVSADLMRAAAAGVDVAIERALALVGAFFGVDRAYVFRFAAGGGRMSNTHEWVSPGISPEARNLQDVPLCTFPWLMRELASERTVLVPDVRALPAPARAERDEFEREGIRSIAIVPMQRGADLVGFVGFDAVRSRIEWTDDYVLGLRLLAQLIVAALESRDLAMQLTELAFHDALTGLPNRPMLEDRMQRALARCERSGASLSLMLIDLDDFKQVNDHHGHAVGDRLLAEVAGRLRAAVREPDTVARLGGDEFVLLVESSATEQAMEIAERALKALESPCRIDELALPISCSIGIASSDGHAHAADLMRRADAAMYRAKREGKRRWAVADPLRDG